MIVSVNPATGEEIARLKAHGREEVDAALDAAVAAQGRWRAVPIAERVGLLAGMARALRADRGRLPALVTAEMGKPVAEAEAEVEKRAVTCDVYAEAAPRFLADEPVASNAAESLVTFDSLGVLLAVMPWNDPMWQVFRFAAPALAAGNGAILKHASNVPGCALAIEEVMREAGCPEGLFHTVLIDASEVASLIANDRVAAVTLTGSIQVGGVVAAQAGAALKKQVLELGGSDPFIVLADADVEEAARVAVKARFTNEAVRLANQTEFGLGAALWTRDLARARGLARRIDAGAVFVNGMVASDARLPFGGIKRSGCGRELGSYGIKEFCNVKTVWIGPASEQAPVAATNYRRGPSPIPKSPRSCALRGAP